MSIHEEGYPDDSGCIDGLLALGRTPRVDSMSCTECLFPFCVRAETRVLKNMARNLSIIAMHSMHASVRTIAARTGMNIRTVYDVVGRSKETRDCYWCKVNLKQGGVFCRCSSCTVAYDNGNVAVTLSAHKNATSREVGVVETLVGNLFPDGVMTSTGNGPHDHWVMNRVGESEASSVYDHMTELSQYTTGLR